MPQVQDIIWQVIAAKEAFSESHVRISTLARVQRGQRLPGIPE